jgi:hypothetical protein
VLAGTSNVKSEWFEILKKFVSAKVKKKSPLPKGFYE